MRRLGVTRRASDRAVDAAYAAQREFQDKLLEAGRRALAVLDADRRARPGAGRPRLQHLRPRRQLRYPAQAAPPLRRQRDPAGFPGDRARARRPTCTPTCSGSPAARSWKPRAWPPAAPNLHLVYITNFKCGPDSYIKHFAREAAGAPLLILQFDGHGNDAGYMTRCEAYLDSKGILRCYQSPTQQPTPPQVRRAASTKRQAHLHPAHGLRQRAGVRLGLPRHRPGRRAHAALRPPHARTGRALHLRRRMLSGQSDRGRLHEGAGAARDRSRARRALHAHRRRAPAASASTRPTCARSWTPTATATVEILSPTSQNAYDGPGQRWPSPSCAPAGARCCAPTCCRSCC